jgi:ribonuclease-3
MRTRRRSRRSARPSTTSPRTPERGLQDSAGRTLIALAEALPADLRRRAFAHSSWAREPGSSYERLEFLGDSVLGLSIARHLYEAFPERPEGDLARLRAHVVSRQSCAAVGRELGLAALLRREAAAQGLEQGGAAELVADSDTVLAELVEAVIGACLLEYGFEPVAAATVVAFATRVDYALLEHVDHKTVLQEQLARRGRSVTYALVEAIGPDHDRRFITAAIVDGDELGRGSGPSKKASEQEAAREALRRISRAEG